jgi:hypothetical protein
MDEREPDISDDPRKQDEGKGGYPEDDPTGSSGSGSEGRKGSGGQSAPDTEGGQDESPSGATGNPGAAGG